MNFQERTADLLYSAVRRAAVSPEIIAKGDLIVVTEADSDTIGTVTSSKLDGNHKTVILNTRTGTRTLQIDDTHFVHVIQKAAMLDLRKHYQYERTDEASNKEVDRLAKNKDVHKERPEFCEEISDKSALPTSKISLSLRKEVKET